MDNRYLQYILVLAETGNMTRAAEKLYISQPTLSQFLTKQEQEIGMPLFQRQNGVFTLTAAGNLYAEYARTVLQLTDKLAYDLQNLSDISRIYIGTSSSKAVQMLSSILVPFRERYPLIELVLSDDSIRTNLQLIEQNKMDFAFITMNSLESYNENSIELKKEEIVLAISSAHPAVPLIEKEDMTALTISQTIEYFKDTPFILQHKGSCIRTLIDSLFKKHNFNPSIACCTSNAQSICTMADSNIGIGFVPIGSAKQTPTMRYFSLNPNMYRTHVILYRKDLVLEAPHKYLIELASKYAEENWPSPNRI